MSNPPNTPETPETSNSPEEATLTLELSDAEWEFICKEADRRQITPEDYIILLLEEMVAKHSDPPPLPSDRTP